MFSNLVMLVKQTNIQATAYVDRGKDVLDDLQLLRVKRRHDVPQVDAPNLQQHLIVNDLLQQLQVLHREEHVYASPAPNTPTLKVQILNVIHVVVQDGRENHLQLLITQFRSYTSFISPSLTHEAQHLNISHIAAL